MKKLILSALALVTLAYIGLCTVLYFQQGALLYMPQPRAMTDPHHTLPLTTDAGSTLITTAVQTTGKAVIYFGGNGEDVSRNLSVFRKIFPDRSLYLMHYRGYGGSDGAPSEQGITRDAAKLYDLVSQQNKDIVLIGRSLGSGVATRLASTRAPSRLILVTPYSSVEDVASERYWGFPVSLLLKDKYESWRYASSVTASTAILVADNDAIIPLHSSIKLLNHFKQGLAQLYTFEGAGHASISTSQQYYELLHDLVNQ